MASTKAKFKVYNGTEWVEYDFGGSAPSNMVTTDTEQTISGNKIFTNNVTIFDSYLNLNACDIIFNNNTDHCIWLSSDATYGTEIAFMVDDTTPVYLGNGSIRAGGDLKVKSNLQIDNKSINMKNTSGDAYINFNSDYYSGLLFRSANGGTSGQPSAAVSFNYDTDELQLYSAGGVYCNGGLYEDNTSVPYRIGYKYSGYVSSTSTATSKYYVCFQFFDDIKNQSYLSNRGMNITSMSNLIAALKRAGHTSAATACPASGKYGSNNIVGVYSNGTNLYIQYVGYSANTNTVTATYLSATNTTIGTVSFNVINS